MTTNSPKSSVTSHALLVLALAPAAAMLFLWPSASAQTPAKSAQMTVSIETVVGQDADVRLPQSRIVAAARSVCAKVAIHSPLNPREQSDCQRETTARAMKQLIEMGNRITVASAD